MYIRKTRVVANTSVYMVRPFLGYGNVYHRWRQGPRVGGNRDGLGNTRCRAPAMGSISKNCRLSLRLVR